MRFCLSEIRPWDTKMAAGTDINGPAVLSFHRDCRCMPGACKCCCYQEVTVQDGAGTPLGGIIEKFWYCVPNYGVYSSPGQFTYDVHQPSCCNGMCVNCCAQGLCNCRIPFYLYTPDGDETTAALSSKSTPVPGMEKEVPKAQITKIWTNLEQELFTDADTFEVRCPDNSDVPDKARMIAATLLINQLYFERSKNDITPA